MVNIQHCYVDNTVKSSFQFNVIRHRDVIILTRRPETSEYFLAGLKDGGASILKSGGGGRGERKKEKEDN